MGKIGDFFKKIFGKQPKMLNSGENEVAEAGSHSQKNEFKEGLKKQVEISNIDPSRYQDENDLYIAILEELGISKDFKNNPRAKADLIKLVDEIKRPDDAMLISMQKDENYSKFLMDLLDTNIKVNKEGNEIEYPGEYLSWDRNKLHVTKLTNVFSISKDNYTKNEHTMGTRYDYNKNVDNISQHDVIHTYDKNGIEVKKEKLHFKEFETEPKKIDIDGITYPYVRNFSKVDDKLLESKNTMTRLSYINNTQENDLADFLTVYYSEQNNEGITYGGNVTLKDSNGYENIDIDEYDMSMLSTLQYGSIEQKRKLDKFHNSDGTSIKKEYMERVINNHIISRELYGEDCKILKNYMAPIMKIDNEKSEILVI